MIHEVESCTMGYLYEYASLSIFQILIDKERCEIMGLVMVESGWGSLIPTVVIANMSPFGAAARSGKLNSCVGLPLVTVQQHIRVSFRSLLVCGRKTGGSGEKPTGVGRDLLTNPIPHWESNLHSQRCKASERPTIPPTPRLLEVQGE